MIPDPRDPFFGTPALPDWVKEFRQHQWDAVQEIVGMFQSGVKVVMLDAPTGSGKTLIGEVVRRIIGQALYVCSSKGLQDQFVKDFPYARVLKGKANYRPQIGGSTVTCADCTLVGRVEAGAECDWCPVPGKCEFRVAKKIALASSLAVINTAYLLYAGNYSQDLRCRQLVILDEADVLERELMGFVEVNVSSRVLELVGLEAPRKGSHKTTIETWIREELMPGVKKWVAENAGMKRNVQVARRRDQMRNLLRDLDGVLGRMTDDNWVRDNDAGPMVLKPVRVADYGQRYLWRHGEKWLCMSGTLISAEEMADSLGLRSDEWGLVRVPMTFPKEHRPIHMVPVSEMTAAEQVRSVPLMALAIKNVLDKHYAEKVLIHTVSYKLASLLWAALKRLGCTREIFTYDNAQAKAVMLEAFVESQGAAVMLAPSLDRGVDLPGDLCRVVIVAKVPYPYLGDRQISTRSNQGHAGRQWYAVQTVRTLVQMTGRGVRSESDWCVTYVLDASFGRLYREWKGLFPKWWRDAVKTDQVSVKELVRDGLGGVR